MRFLEPKLNIVRPARQPAYSRRADAAGLFILGLLVNGLAARWVTAPGYMDAYYYFEGARSLARREGLTERYRWNYLAQAVAAGNYRWPSHLYWMPLASLMAAPALWLAERAAGGPLPNADLFRAAQIPSIVGAAALPVLSYLAAQLLTGRRRHALGAGLLTLFSAYYFVLWTTTDAFALFGLAAAGALLAAAAADTRPAHQVSQWLFAAGLGAGMAHLARADGVLVLVCLLGWQMLRPSRLEQPGRAWWRDSLLLILGYGLVMAPWYARNVLVTGAPLAPGAARTLWLTEYDDFFTYTPERLTLANYLAAGWAKIARGKLAALAANLGTLAAAQTNVVLLPFALVGFWRLRSRPLAQLAGAYGLSLFVLMTVVFSFPGARGGYLHSGVALLPFLLPAALAGLDAVVEAVARRRPHWQPEKSQPVFTGLAVAGVVVMAATIFALRVVGPDWRQPRWSQHDRAYAESGAWLIDQAGPAAIVAVNNPPGWTYFTDQPSLVIPNGGVDVLLEAMAAEQARWLVLEDDRPADLAQLYAAPESEPRLALRATFTDENGRPVYVLERTAAP